MTETRYLGFRSSDVFVEHEDLSDACTSAHN